MARFQAIEISESKVLAALDANNGNQRRAAEKLGVTQGWVTQWLKKHGYVQKITWVKPGQTSKSA